MRTQSIAPLILIMAACSGETAEQRAETAAELRRAAAADTMRMASEAYDMAGFESIEWPSDSAAMSRGSIVWNTSCMKCHGLTGVGDAGFVLLGDTLRPPSLIEPDWRFADDLDGMRRYIFAGNEGGMPHWGIVGLKPQDVDAVARYIQGSLRAPGN